MLTNADITIYHKRYNPETRLDEWQAAQYPGVNWYGRQSVTVGDSGLNTADSYIVRIPTTELIEVWQRRRCGERACKRCGCESLLPSKRTGILL